MGPILAAVVVSEIDNISRFAAHIVERGTRLYHSLETLFILLDAYGQLP
jgi:hypothetical protein